MAPLDVLKAIIDRLSDGEDKVNGMQALRKLEQSGASRTEELDFHEILDHLSASVYVSDAEGRTVYVNQTYIEETGIAALEVLGKTVEELQEEGGLFRGGVTPEVIRLKKGVRSVSTLLKNNRMTPGAVMGAPVFDEDGSLKLVVCTIWKTPHMRDFYRRRTETESSGEMLFRKKYGLTQRELEIIDLLFYGNTYKGVANELFISLNTVRTHMRNIYRKTGVDNMGALLQMYKDFKLIDRDIFP